MREKASDKYLCKKITTLKDSAIGHRSNRKPGHRRYWMYDYLKDVYEAFLEIKSKGIAKPAGRQIIKLFELRIRKKSHILRVLIEASAGEEDRRTKIKWANALRYAHGWLQRPDRLEWFFGVGGGIAGCAAEFANLRKKRRERKSINQSGAPQPLAALPQTSPNINLQRT